MSTEFWMICAFTIFIFFMLFVDLKLFHREAHTISMKEAVGWSIFWIALALIFNVVIFYTRGVEPALNFLTGYLLEKALSVDNLFVFLLIFSYFKVPSRYTHQVLFWGIIGALIMRAIFIAFGIALVSMFNWILYLFGAFLIFAGIKLALEKDKEIDLESNFILRTCKRFIPITKEYHGKDFFVKIGKKWMATPLFVVLIAIETTDVFFALDSIPAILAITLDPFIVYTSNIFAILGLRSLYFVLNETMQLFHHLHYGLAFILSFIGVKMLVHDLFKIPIWLTLSIVVVSIGGSIVASILWPQPEHKLPPKA